MNPLSIIVLGENLDKDVVAEGVEQVEDLYLLDAERCYKYQGYLFSRPLPPGALLEWLQGSAGRTEGAGEKSGLTRAQAIEEPVPVDR